MNVVGGVQEAVHDEAISSDRTPAVGVANLTKRFTRLSGQVVPAIDAVSFDVSPGEFVVLLGPSGCGKTTLLRSIAGLERPDAGSIAVHGRTVFDSNSNIDLPPDHRDLAMIFQSYALWPHMTVFQNVGFPLKCRRVKRLEMASRVQAALERVDVAELSGQYPGQLSGGQQQRVALARALVANESVVLLDEPLSNVDAKVRERLRHELLSLQRDVGFAAIYVTHDQVEAMDLADRIAVMRAGRIEQFGSPYEIYSEPRSMYVAKFVGSTSCINGTVSGAAAVATAIGEISGQIDPSLTPVGTTASVIWRPERASLSVDEPKGVENRWHVQIVLARFVGTHMRYVVRLGDDEIEVWETSGTTIFREGQKAWVGVFPRDVRVLPVAADEPGLRDTAVEDQQLAIADDVSLASQITGSI